MTPPQAPEAAAPPEAAPPEAAPPEAAPPELGPRPKPSLSVEDLHELIGAYNGITEKLQRSHETLQSEVQRLREQLAAKDEQLQRGKRLAALGEMAAGIAHEVRNPLGAIGLYAELIAADLEIAQGRPGGLAAAAGPVREARSNAGKIGGAVRSLSAVVNDVLSFAQQAEPRRVPCDARALLAAAAEAARPELDAAGVQVRIRSEGVTLDADPELVHRALLNLVRNAAEAMAGSEPGRPRVLTLAAGPGRLRVVDTGPGIDPAAAERLFNPFFTTRGSGTGLGLAIVHRLVDAHGGAVSVADAPAPGGAAFTLCFPPPQPAG